MFLRTASHTTAPNSTTIIDTVVTVYGYVIHINYKYGHPQNFLMGGQRQKFAYRFQVADNGMQMYVHKTLYPFCTTNKMSHVMATVTKMSYFGSNSQVYYDNLRNRLQVRSHGGEFGGSDPKNTSCASPNCVVPRKICFYTYNKNKYLASKKIYFAPPPTNTTCGCRVSKLMKCLLKSLGQIQCVVPSFCLEIRDFLTHLLGGNCALSLHLPRQTKIFRQSQSNVL